MFHIKTRSRARAAQKTDTSITIALPANAITGNFSLEGAIAQRRSVRDYNTDPVSLPDIAQLLWAAQGMTGEGKRTAPSAGGLYPMEVYLIAVNILGLMPGVYRYIPSAHALQVVSEGDKRKQISTAALMQHSIRHCAATIVFVAEFGIITEKYFHRGKDFVNIEAGHAAQNVLLQAVPLHIGAVPVGAFIKGLIRKTLELPAEKEPLYLVVLGMI